MLKASRRCGVDSCRPPPASSGDQAATPKSTRGGDSDRPGLTTRRGPEGSTCARSRGSPGVPSPALPSVALGPDSASTKWAGSSPATPRWRIWAARRPNDFCHRLLSRGGTTVRGRISIEQGGAVTTRRNAHRSCAFGYSRHRAHAVVEGDAQAIIFACAMASICRNRGITAVKALG